MKGNVRKILAANTAIQYMDVQGGAPFKVVRSLSKLRKALADEAQIAEEQQEKLIKDLDGKFASGVVLSFPDVKTKEKFEKAWEDVLDTEVEIDLDRLDLSAFADNIIFHNTNVDVDALSTFIDFDGEK